MPAIPDIDELVINRHVTEACNFRCRYCYASWEKPETKTELWKNEAASFHLLATLVDFFNASNLANPLRQNLRWRSQRLSIAGGEPTLLGSRLTDIASRARALGFNVSMITNGSRPEAIAAVVPYLDMLGLSVDSLRQETNVAIGRGCPTRGQASPYDIVAIARQARVLRPGIAIKINTVINSVNVGEDMSELIRRVQPDHWKVMRMLPVVTDALSVDGDAFQNFVSRHKSCHPRITFEDNSDMTRSYVMVDPHGRFFQNQPHRRGYQYSRPILEAGVGTAFSEISFSPGTFFGRYEHRVRSNL